MSDLFEKIKTFITANPHYFGLFFVLIGVATLISAIKDANWLFGDVNSNTYNLEKLMAR